MRKRLLTGGGAAGGGEGAGEVSYYLRWCLESAPDLGRVGDGRRTSSGRCGRPQWLATAGAASERPSGASQMFERDFCGSDGRRQLVGRLRAAVGEWGGVLFSGSSGSFGEVAGGSANGSGRLDCCSGVCGGDLGVGRISGLWAAQVFVVKFGGCGGWLGSRSGALERWRFGESRGGLWEKVVGRSGGNC